MPSFETVYGFAIGIGVGFGLVAIWIYSSIIAYGDDCEHPLCPHHGGKKSL